MHKVVMRIPRRPDVGREQFGATYLNLCSCLTSCLPSIIEVKQGSAGPAPAGPVIESFELTFESESQWRFAQASQEWMSLIDSTSDVLDWESARTLSKLPVHV